MSVHHLKLALKVLFLGVRLFARKAVLVQSFHVDIYFKTIVAITSVRMCGDFVILFFVTFLGLVCLVASGLLALSR